MTTADYVKSSLATLLWNEDHSDALVGLVVVGCVVANRVKAGWFGGDWIQVIEHHNDWSAAPNTGRLVLCDYKNDLFTRLMWKVDSIFGGFEFDIACGGLYYANLNNVTSEWFKSNVLGDLIVHPRLSTTGKITVFK